MPTSIYDIVLSNAQLSDLANSQWMPYDSPFEAWSAQTSAYKTYKTHYDGESLLAVVEDKNVAPDKQPLLYPLRMNKWAMTCDMHAMLMWGQSDSEKEDIRFLAERINPLDKKDTDKELSGRMGILFLSVLSENGGQEMLREASKLFQVFGGHYFKVVHDPTYQLGVRIESLPANICYPIWNPANYRELYALVVSYQITKRQAKELYGYEPQNDIAVYTESWDRENYVVRVDEKVITEEKNPYVMPGATKAHVPFIYIPRMRSGSFYGRSALSQLAGLVQEYNARAADMGDAIASSAHRRTWMRNVREDVPNLNQLADGETINLGQELPGSGKPEMGVLDPPKVMEGSMEFLEFVRREQREQSLTAPVIMGDDEGSQRSALTLAMRALPTVTAVKDYRASWAKGFERMAMFAFLAMSLQPNKDEGGLTGARLNGVNDEWFKFRLSPAFAQMLPRDRDAIVQETTTLYSAGLRSMELALQRLGDVHDVEAEADAIKKAQEEKAAQDLEKMQVEADTMAKAKAAAAPKPAPKTK